MLRSALQSLGISVLVGTLLIGLWGCQAGPAGPPRDPQVEPGLKPAVASDGSTVTERASEPGEALLENWYAGAKQEGKFVLYSTLRQPEWDQVMEGFRKRYPGVELELTRLSGQSLLQRTLTEFRAGRFAVDLADGEWAFLDEPGMVAAERLPGEVGLPVEVQSKDGRWHWARANYGTIAYNERLVPSDPPRTFDALLQPRWRGNLFAVADDPEHWIALLLHKFDGRIDRLQSYLEGLAANNPSVRTGHGATTDLLAAGERGVVANIHPQVVAIAKSKGQPVAVPTEEGTKVPSPLLIMNRAPHPNAARLFANYLQTRDAQEAIAAGGRFPSRTDVKPPFDVVPKRVYLFEPERGLSLYQEIDRLARKILEGR